MKWGIAIGVVLLAAAAWPADAPPVRLPAEPEPAAAPPPVPTPEPAAPECPPAGVCSRDPGDPPPPPEPPPTRPPKRLGMVIGFVEDEAGYAIPGFSLQSRTFGCGRSSRPAGHGVTGAGGTFRFTAARLDYHLDAVPPGHRASRALFTVSADGFARRAFRLSEDDELTLRRGGRVTGVRMVLPRAVIVEGRIFLPDGHPAPAYWVTIRRKRDDGKFEHVSWARADKQGWFRFPHLEPEPGLHVHSAVRQRKPDRTAVSEHLALGDDLVPGEIVHIDVRLGPWAPKK